MKPDVEREARRLVGERVKQGLKRTCADPSTIARIAGILREADVPKKKAAPPRAARVAEVAPSVAQPPRSRTTSQQQIHHRRGRNESTIPRAPARST